MGHFLQDVRLAFRHLRQQPGFTCVAVLTLAIGLGANTTVFTLVHALMLRSLPVERPHELYRLGDTTDCCVNSGLATSYSLFSFRLFEHLKANAPEFSDLTGFQANTMPLAVRRGGETAASSLPGAFVTANYFTTFGVTPAAGRLLRTDDDRAGAPPVAVMSHRAWTQHFGQDPGVIGGEFVINRSPFTIVGVASPQFFGDTIRPDPAAIWIPIGQEPAMRGSASLIDRVDQNWLYAIGRLKPGANPAQIGARVTTALQQWLSSQTFLTDRDRPEIPKQHIVVAPAGGGVGLARIQYARALNLLFAASAMVLLIGAANLANLLLARTDRGQAAIRAALGASTGRLIRQALTEGIVISLLGGLAGIAVATISTRMLINVVFPNVGFVPVDATPSAARVAVRTGAGCRDRCPLHGRAGLGHVPHGAPRCARRSRAHRPAAIVRAARLAPDRSSCALARAADERRPAWQQPQQPGAATARLHGHQPIRRQNRSASNWRGHRTAHQSVRPDR